MDCLYRLKKQICMAFSPKLATCIESLAYCQDIASPGLSLHHLGQSLTDLTKLLPLKHLK